ncbi:hypothetical protein Dda_1675 [Drechslerella dactyloides]|uniref:Adenylate kinase n=1 Tax=Drechslerella dactyloides TaxID=74499 RepID=A0AAD6J6I0_DREDA|nr:hypothetical protein Dda_1675 [Drechslerella dactyloides]
MARPPSRPDVEMSGTAEQPSVPSGGQASNQGAQAPVYLQDFDRMLSGNSLPTISQAVENLRIQGFTDAEILSQTQNGTYVPAAAMVDYDSLPDPFSQEEKEIFELVGIMSGAPGAWKGDPNSSHSRTRHRPIKIPEYGSADVNPPKLDSNGVAHTERKPTIVIIFVTGAPSSGKTTVAKQICQKYHFVYINPRELLERERRRPDSLLKDVLDEALPKGEQGPFMLMGDFMLDEIEQKTKSGFNEVFLIDDFPRDLERAGVVERMVQPCDKLLNFDCSDRVSCGRYIEAGWSQLEDEDGDVEDDVKHALMAEATRRSQIYRQEAPVVLNHYMRRGKVATINAEGTIAETQREVELILKNTIIDGFVGMRSETVDKRNREAWTNMKMLLEQVLLTRLQSDNNQLSNQDDDESSFGEDPPPSGLRPRDARSQGPRPDSAGGPGSNTGGPGPGNKGRGRDDNDLGSDDDGSHSNDKVIYDKNLLDTPAKKRRAPDGSDGDPSPNEQGASGGDNTQSPSGEKSSGSTTPIKNFFGRLTGRKSSAQSSPGDGVDDGSGSAASTMRKSRKADKKQSVWHQRSGTSGEKSRCVSGDTSPDVISLPTSEEGSLINEDSSSGSLDEEDGFSLVPR